MALVKQGLGVTIIDEFVAQDSGLVVKPLKENIEFDVSFVYSRFEPVSESAHRMMHVLLSQAISVGWHIEGFVNLARHHSNFQSMTGSPLRDIHQHLGAIHPQHTD